MGSCMSGDKQKTSTQVFKKDSNLVQKTQIYQPLTTTLFNTMRKYNDIIVIFADPNKAKEFSGVVLDDVKSLLPKSLKMMYSFKRLIVVGTIAKVQNDLLELTKLATITSVYIVETKSFQKFQKLYPLFNSLSEMSSSPTSKIPLLVFSSTQLIRPPQKPYQIFIHSVDQRDTQVYSKLKIQGIIQPSGQQNQYDEIRHYIDKLKANNSSRVVLLHTKSLGQSALMEILSQYLIYLYQAGEISIKGYLARTLPNVSIIPTMSSSKPLQEATKQRTVTNTNVDQFHKLFKQHLNEGNLQKTERAYNLLGKLIANIISNPQAENYRKVKGINKQMEELLTRSRAGTQLLKLVGFNQDAGFWVNELEAKYLKVLRADMDLGYRKAVNENGGQE